MSTPEMEAYREDYRAGRLSFAAAMQGYERIVRPHVGERHAFFDEYGAWMALDIVNEAHGRDRAAHVVEIGGWRGELAFATTGRWSTWDNYEGSTWALNHQACTDPGYTPRRLLTWAHDAPLLYGDVLVMTHVVEHMTSGELDMLVRRSLTIDGRRRWRHVYVEAPLPAGDHVDFSWEGTDSLHVLPLGWDNVDELFADATYHGTVLRVDGRSLPVRYPFPDPVETRCVLYTTTDPVTIRRNRA